MQNEAWAWTTIHLDPPLFFWMYEGPCRLGFELHATWLTMTHHHQQIAEQFCLCASCGQWSGNWVECLSETSSGCRQSSSFWQGKNCIWWCIHFVLECLDWPRSCRQRESPSLQQEHKQQLTTGFDADDCHFNRVSFLGVLNGERRVGCILFEAFNIVLCSFEVDKQDCEQHGELNGLFPYHRRCQVFRQSIPPGKDSWGHQEGQPLPFDGVEDCDTTV